MLYEKYSARMTKLAEILAAIKKFRILIISVCAVIVAVTVSLLAISGLVYDVDKCPESIAVGDNLGYSAGAIFKGVSYEFSVAGSETWTAKQPVRPGEYLVRSVSKSVFGTDRYGSAHAFTVIPRTVEVTVEQTTVVYGDNPEVKAELCYGDVINCNSFIFKDYSKAQTQVKADVSEITVLDTDGNDVTSSYIFNAVESDITFSPREITIVVDDRPEVYGGVTYTCGGYEIEGGESALAEGDYAAVMSVNFSGEAGEFDITPEVQIIKNNGGDLVNVTANYAINIVSGKLTVEKRPVYVSTGSARKLYDGNKITSSYYELDENFPLVEGHSLEIIEIPSLTNAGEINNVVLFAVKDKDGNDVTANYSVLYKEYGLLKVMPRPVTIRTADENAVYDGNAHYSETFYVLELEESSLFIDGDTPQVISRTEKTLAGEYSNELGFKVFNADGEDVSGNYEIDYVLGTLEIARRSIVIHTLDREWIYDGETHSYNGHILTDEGYDLVEGHSTEASGLATVTNVGTVANSMIIGIYDSDGNIVTDNYNIERVIPGTITVTPREITVAAASAIKVYDGEELTANYLEVTSETQLVEGHLLHGEAQGSQTFKGWSLNVIANPDEITITAADGTDVTENYVLAKEDGILTVTARNILVVTEGGRLIYNGEYQYNLSFTVDKYGDFGVAEGEVAKVDEEAGYTKLKDVAFSEEGEVKGFPNVFSVRIFRTSESGEEVDVTENYEIDYAYWDIEIIPRPVTFVSKSKEFIYNGANQSFDGHEVYSESPFELAKGHVSKAECLTSVKNVSDSGAKNQLNITIYDGEGEDAENVTQNYAVTVLDEGILTVNPRPLYIETKDAEKVYDDTPLNSKEYYAQKGENDYILTDPEEDSGLVFGHSTNSVDNREITEVQFDKSGEEVVGVENTLKLKICDGEENEVNENYEVHYTYGKLKITKRPVKYLTSTETFIYDGETHYAGWKRIEGTLAEGHHDNNANTATAITDVGTETSEVDVLIIKWGDQGEFLNLSENYQIDYENGTLTVTERKIIVTADDAEKIYDGTALTSSKVTVTYGGSAEDENQQGLVKDHIASAQMTAESTVTNVTDENGVTNVIAEGSVKITSGEIDVTKNYEIVQYVDGKLVVTPRPITVTADDAEKIYDATELTCKTFKITYTDDTEKKALVLTHIAEVEIQGSVTEVGEEDNANIVESVKIYSDESKTEEVTSNYDITKTDGTLTVTPRKIKITAGDETKVYDGTALTFESVADYKNYKVQSNHDPELDPAVVKGQVIVLTVNGSQTDADESENSVNTVTIYSDETKTKEVTGNYEIEKIAGKLKVTPRPITVTTEDKDWIYDGNTYTHTEYEVAKASGNDDGLVSGHTHAVDTEKDIAEICEVIYDNDDNLSYIDNKFEIVISAGGTDVTANYKINYVYGKLVMNPRPITVTTEDQSWVYDGEEHSYAELDKGYVITAGKEISGKAPLVTGHIASALDPTTVTDVTEVGGVSNIMTLNIVDGEGVDKNGNYIINYFCDGKLSITARPITIVAANDTKVYNGKAQSGEKFTTNSALGLVEGHIITATTNESYEVVGSYKVTVASGSASICDEYGVDKTENYAIAYDESVEADFEITKRQITLKADDDNTVYNGEEQYGKKFTTVSELGLAEGHTVEATTNGYTDVDEHPVSIVSGSATIYNADKEDVTEYYEITYDDTEAVLNIDYRFVYITTGSATKPYDGMPLTCNEYEFDEPTADTGILAGHNLSFIIIGSQTEPGSSYNTVDEDSIVIEDAYGTDVRKNYYIVFRAGTLTVTDETAPDPIIKIESDKDIHVYLRATSYGAYNGTTEWDYAEEYGATITYNGLEYSANYLTSLALQNAGHTADSITITYLVNLYGAHLPYYLTATDNYRQTSDVEYSGDMKKDVPYTPSYYAYDYLASGALTLPAQFKQFEQDYSQFVYNHYLSIDNVTGQFLDEIISSQGFDGYDINDLSALHELISNVAHYIQGAAKYNLNYDRQAVDTDNVVISFLTVKEGVCRHYASAATMLFRRLGIPARYTTGISAYVNAGTPAQPTAGHAWVEVYINGLGWVMVEVTGADESGNGSGGNATPKPEQIVLKPQDSVKKYDGEPLVATALEDNDGLSYLKANGYTFSVTFGGSQTEIGISESNVETFILYDAQGNDVTRDFSYKREKGKLEVVNETVIYVHTLSTSKVYNGSLQTFGAGDYYCSSELDNFKMPSGCNVTVSGLENVGLTDVGVLTQEQFEQYVQNGTVKITVTKNGSPVREEELRLEFDVHFEIVPIVLTFTTNSVTRVYNGKELSDTDISRAFSGDSLVAGHKAVVVDYAKITDVGTVQNIILIDIVDSYGNTVTHNYDIHDQFGTLTVLSD